MFGSKEDMIEQAEERLVDLRERGYQKAGLYNPQGVGGTHVMYVLKNAEDPESYSGLPKDPRISPMVGLWKGAFKPIALLAFGATALAGFLHYIKVGPKEVEEDADAGNGGKR